VAQGNIRRIIFVCAVGVSWPALVLEDPLVFLAGCLSASLV
jgi:hypothetical protein